MLRDANPRPALRGSLGLGLLLSISLLGSCDSGPIKYPIPNPPGWKQFASANLETTVNESSQDIVLYIPANSRVAFIPLRRTGDFDLEASVERRATSLFEQAIFKNLAGRSSMTAYSNLSPVLDVLERSGLGGDTEQIRLGLLQDSLADVLIIPVGSKQDDGVPAISLQAIDVRSGNVYGSTAPRILPVGAEYSQARDKERRKSECYVRRYQSCITSCFDNYGGGNKDCYDNCAFDDKNMSRWIRVCQ